ncbi:putative disease resistance RPP13-like protein 1 [Vitis vinifera]|uniref:Putative disease resistance RPP13-like protein 1 n=1 Tax=Vitis vinifera TaxID=29760 RepID=A0A438CLU6_VITVI|nr:putative disease resistance RPP13-like protein 1 [Vitis vinifera]
MAAALVGGAFLSASLQVLFDRLASREVVKFIRGHELDDALLKKLKRKLLTVHAVLNDAEAKQITNPAVKEWMDELKVVVYDAEDVLDEIATEDLRCKIEAADTLTSMSTWVHPPLDIQSINSRVEEIIGRLNDIAQDRDVLGLKEGVGEKLAQRWPSTSLVDESLVYGRDQIKEEMVQLLLSDNERSTDAMGAISIVGMGGTGKTTLAQLLYNDQRVKEHFEIKAWVCVSEEFDPIRVTKTILEAINSSTSNTTDLNLLQGSKIIVTTRSTNVASAMRAVHTRCLGGLSSEDARSLFKKLAFENGDSSGHPQLEAIGEKIVHKCQGLPLAIKAMGSLLHSKVEAREWDDVLNSEIWDLPTDAVLPALRLSYYYLPSHLKRCFSYCSIFPKDYEVVKEKLVLLWMAEGLLEQPKTKKRLEEMENLINLRYLDIHLTFGERDASGICKLKNLQSLSTFIVGQNGGLRLGALRELSGSLVISNLENVVCDRDALEANMKDKKYLDKLKFEWEYYENTDWFKLSRLGRRSFILQSVDPGASELRGEFPRLQELCISECPKLTGKLPKQLRSLKKLESLVVSCLWVPSELLKSVDGKCYISQLEELPPRIQTLRIRECDSIEWVLEEGMLQGSTCLLQHLHIRSCRFSRPLHSVGLSTTLKSLDMWKCTSRLEFLSISISEGDPTSLNCLKIRKCPDLVYIELPALESARYEISRCRKLKLLAHTHSSLQGLRLASLTKFKINDGCRDMESFPNESLLPSTLTSLEIERLPNLKSLDSNGLRHLTSLTTLYISNCPKFQSFGEEGLQHLTSLEKLEMVFLPVLESLREVGLQHLTSLKELSISYCHHLQCLTKERLPNSLSRLKIKSCPLLEHGCQFEKGQDWEYIAHIPRIVIGGVLY